MSNYPMHGYLYTADGFHGPPEVLRNRDDLWTFLALAGGIALRERRELRLTSGDDDDLYVHIQDGIVRHAAGADPGLFTEALLAAGEQPGLP
jgi:hypothetical protein